MKKRFSVFGAISFSLAGLAVGVLCCSIFFVHSYGGTELFPYATKFAAVMNAVDSSFVGEAEPEKVADSAYAAAVAATEDRWSYYMTAEQFESYKQYQKNSYTGIGITIVKDEESGLLRVAGMAEDSPAQMAGVTIGDLLEKIDDENLEGLSPSDIKEIISSKNGKEFLLGIIRSNGKREELTVKSGVIFTEPVEYELLDGNIAYIRIKNFEGKCADGTLAAVDELMKKGATSIIFDVRNDPGGLLSELVRVLDYLLPEGEMFVSVDQNGNETVTKSDPDCIDLPMAVLVNENSYSAAEFFAAALSEYDKAVIVGTQTTGKSRSQTNVVFSDGSAVHLSTAGYLTPNRVDLAAQGGLSPEVSIDLAEEDEAYLAAGLLEHQDDNQLLAAIDALMSNPAE